MIQLRNKIGWLGCSALLSLQAFAAGEAKTADDVVKIPPDLTITLLTWVVFGLMLLVLYKFGFKPILESLDKREQTIRDGIETAEKARQEMAKIEASRAELIQEAESQAKKLIEDGRKAAQEAARTIQDKAKDDAQILLENARREIKTAEEKARASLRKESGDLAVKLASRLLSENLDDAHNRQLVDKLIKEI